MRGRLNCWFDAEAWHIGGRGCYLWTHAQRCHCSAVRVCSDKGVSLRDPRVG
jgi:hypothetical protein